MKKALENLEIIKNKEPEVFEALSLCIEHIAGCYSDKYEVSKDTMDTKKLLYGRNGAAINAYQVQRYLQRYQTEGNAKSFLVKDLLKSVHYLIFEITRRVKDKTVDLIEPKH